MTAAPMIPRKPRWQLLWRRGVQVIAFAAALAGVVTVWKHYVGATPEEVGAALAGTPDPQNVAKGDLPLDLQPSQGAGLHAQTARNPEKKRH